MLFRVNGVSMVYTTNVSCMTNKAVITLQKVVANFKGSIIECSNVSKCTCDSVKTLKKTLLKMNLVTYGCQGFH